MPMESENTRARIAVPRYSSGRPVRRRRIRRLLIAVRIEPEIGPYPAGHAITLVEFGDAPAHRVGIAEPHRLDARPLHRVRFRAEVLGRDVEPRGAAGR